jgi:hypothetical protein
VTAFLAASLHDHFEFRGAMLRGVLCKDAFTCAPAHSRSIFLEHRLQNVCNLMLVIWQ